MSFKRVDLRCKQLNADLVDGRDFLADSLWLSTVPYAAMPVYLSGQTLTYSLLSLNFLFSKPLPALNLSHSFNSIGAGRASIWTYDSYFKWQS